MIGVPGGNSHPKEVCSLLTSEGYPLAQLSELGMERVSLELGQLIQPLPRPWVTFPSPGSPASPVSSGSSHLH